MRRHVVLMACAGMLLATACRSSMQQADGAQAAAEAPPPPMLAMVPQNAFVVLWVPQLPALLQGVSQYVTRLLAGTVYAADATKHDTWRATWGFDPLVAESYRDVGIDVGAGALVLMQEPNTRAMTILGITDPNAFDAAMDRWSAVRGVPGRRVERAIAGYKAMSWVAANDEGTTLYRVFVRNMVIACGDVAPLERWLSRPEHAPSLVQDANAMALWHRSPPGQGVVWMAPQGSASMSVGTFSLSNDGISLESLGAGTGAVPAPALAGMLQRVDPSALALLASVWQPQDAPWKAMDANQWAMVDTAFKGWTGLSLQHDVVPLMAGGATLDVQWSPNGAPVNPMQAAAQLAVVTTVDVQDSNAAVALLERVKTTWQQHPENGRSLERTTVPLGTEQVPVYIVHATANPPAAAANPAAPRSSKRAWMRPAGPGRSGVPALGDQGWRMAVFHNTLVLAVGETAFNRTLTYLAGTSSHWPEQATTGLVRKHIDGRSMMMVLRFGHLAQLLADTLRVRNMPGVGNMFGDSITVLRRLDDVVLSSRVTPDNMVATELEQRFPVDTAQSL